MAKYTQEDYQKAVKIWKEKNPDKDYLDIPVTTIIEVDGVGKINIGKKINIVRLIYKAMQKGEHYGDSKDLTEEEIDYWTKQGMIWDYDKWREENYRKAAKIWKEQNPDKDYLDIPVTAIIEVDGVGKINIGKKINIVRLIYKAMQKGEHYGNNKDLTEEEIDYWTNEGMIWDYDQWKEDNYRKATKIWKEQNPDKDYLDIPTTTIIEIDGVGKVSIGKKINIVRQIYKAMQKGEHYGNNKDLTEEEIDYWTNEGMIWDYDKWKEENNRKAARIWKEQNPDKDYLDITKNSVIKVKGVGRVKIGSQIILFRKIYKAMQKGEHYGTLKDLTDEEIEYWTKEGMIWDYEEYKKNNKTNSKPKNKSLIDKYTDTFKGDTEKAELVVKCLTDLRERRKSKKKEEYNIDNILKEFNVDIETLEKYLGRTSSNKPIKKSNPLEYQGISLKKYCANNGYNYDVIYRAIKLHEFCKNDSLEQLINRSITIYERKGQKEPATWVYEKYGTLVKHILLYLNLDASRILKDMTNYTISLEEAIRHTVFVQTKKTKEQDYLEEVYNYLIEEIDSSKSEEKMVEDIIIKYQKLIKEYNFTQEEHEVVIESFGRYIKIIKEYQKADVGLETNENKKLEKIRDYGLEAEDIEESFFIPLEFDNKVLLGRKSELYKRRQILRQYIIDWDYYTEEEKQVAILKNKFTEEEMKMIEKMRKDIDETIKKTK